MSLPGDSGVPVSDHLLRSILDTLNDIKAELKDGRKLIAEHHDRLNALELREGDRKERGTNAQRWALGLSGFALACVVGMGGYLIGLKSDQMDLRSEVSNVQKFGSTAQRDFEKDVSERLNRFGERFLLNDQSDKENRALIDDTRSRIK